MGIKDLLRFMKPYITPIHVKSFSGKRVGIDAYSWLHKGAYSCSMELMLDPASEKAGQYLSYFMHRVNLLRHYEVIPVVVFDGGNLPFKAATESERRRRREANHALANEKYNEGNVIAALEHFQKAVNISPEMAHQLIQILRMECVEFVVAPYEADAQLAYMSRLSADEGGIAAVITEDSDLIAYGCQSIMFKMDRYGNGEEIKMNDIFNSCQNGISFRSFDIELFTGMCVLAGCDFLSSVPGIGIKKAYNLVSKYRNLDRVLSVLKLDKKREVPEDYVESFRKAIAVFHHARIYNFNRKSLELMKPLSEEFLQSLNGDLDILGPDLPPSLAAQIAEGNLNPITREAFDCPSKFNGQLKNIIKKNSQLKKIPINLGDSCLGAMPNVSTKESCFKIFPINRTSKKITTGNEEIVPDSINYYNEALELKKLISPLRQQKASIDKEEIRVSPNNNPFKKRRLEDTKKSSPLQSAQQESTVTEWGNRSELSSGLLESQESVKSSCVVASSMTRLSHDKAKPRMDQSKPVGGKKNGILRFFSHVPS